MTPEQFVYWLQGALEIPGCALTKREEMIKDHLAQVFTKKTPDYTPQIQNPNRVLPTYETQPTWNPPQIIC